MTYSEALARLAARGRFGLVLGLDRVERTLARLGRPHERLRVVHIAGTNGKGSTAAFAEALCRAAGLRTGLYTSPHLSRLTERIRVDGVEIDREELTRLLVRVEAAAADPLTFFEILTVMAFLHFAEAAVDVAVIEVGLGGRLDATNVVDPAAAIVTGVALDHEAILGSTVEAIAREKGGIFKANRPAIFGATSEAVAALLRREAIAHRADPLLELGREILPSPLPLGLEGAHQASNAALAEAAVRFVVPSLPEVARRTALASVRWPGRLERIASDPPTWVDCAHNPQGAEALARVFSARAPCVLLLGVAADKDAAAIVRPLAPLAAEIVVTEPRSERALAATALAAIAGATTERPVVVEPAIAAALDEGWRRARRLGLPLLACGSIFLVGPLRERCLGLEADPVVVSDPNLRPAAQRA